MCFSAVIRLLVVKTTIYLKKLELLEKTLHKRMTSSIEINTMSHNVTTSAYILVLPCVRSREFKLNNRCKGYRKKKDPKPSKMKAYRMHRKVFEKETQYLCCSFYCILSH